MLFFFFKQKTAYEMRISDWSSDVCSSDLLVGARLDVDAEMLGVAVSDAAVDPVGSDHEVVAVPSGKFGAEFRFVMKDDSEFLGTVAKDVEQHLPADADKAVDRRTINLAAVMDLNVHPRSEASRGRE